ncbi:MAG: carbohydrate-binding protein, partial [Armatimonadota bacterium]
MPSPLRPVLILIAALFVLTAASATTYYVSPQGDDAHTGLKPDAANALRTIQAGADKLRAGDALLIRGGVYRETVVFQHSGTAGRPITVKPYQEENVTVSGCDPVTGWTLHDAAKGIWKAPMPWTLGLGRNQAFEEGKVLIEARYPNKPAPGLGMYVSDLSPLWPTFGEFSIPKETVKDQPGQIVSTLLDGQPDDYWKGAVYYGVHYEGWAAQTGVVESSKSGEITVGDRTRGWWFGSAYGGGYSPEEGRGMLVGHMNALDVPGEWVWQDNVLYLIPRSGKQPVNLEAKHRQLAFDLSGQEYVSLSGLTINAASARLLDSAHCTFDRCDFSYVSHFTKQYGAGQIEDGRDTIKSGETGIFVGGHDNSFLNCSVRVSAGAGFHLRGYHHTIHNCLIDEVSYTAHYLNAITDAVSDFGDYENFLYGGHVITYNTMRNAGRHFFNFYVNGTSSASRTRSGMDYMATLFAHNHLYNGMLQTKDAGFITGYYCSAGTLDGLNSQVAYNVLHDSYDLAAMRWNVLGLVYLDAGSCDVDLYNNLLWAAPGSLQRGLWYNTMCVDVHERDNVFHPEFTRTSAELKPSDFPGQKPFRFGHDFSNPPPLAVWPQLARQRLEAKVAAADLKDGAAISLGDVDFSQGWQSAVLHFASAEKDLNSDRAARQAPRHQKVTDPLIMEVTTNDGLQEKIKTQWTFIYGVADGAWIRFNKMPLGEGYKRFRVIYGNVEPVARTLEVHLDAVDGPLVGEVSLPQTDQARSGHIQIYQAATGTIAPTATGTHDVFLVFHSPDGKAVGEFEYFRFEQYRGQIPLQKNEVKLELRVGSREGEKIGEFYPRSTEAADNYRDLVASLEPVQGKQPLFLVARSAYPGAIGNVEWLSLEKAKQPIDWTGVTGVPPLSAKGKPVYPQATNRPCARPGDQFPKGRDNAAGSPGRPIVTAQA